MCIIVFAQNYGGLRLVIAANRDEYLDRPTAPAHWNGDVFGGSDLAGAGYKSPALGASAVETQHTLDGTWMGINRNMGRFGFLTNYREPALSNDSLSRGMLVRDYLYSSIGPREYLDSIYSKRNEWNGFHLVVGDVNEMWHFTNRDDALIEFLLPGRIYGLCNGPFHLNQDQETWPKLILGTRLFRDSLTPPEGCNVIPRDVLVPRLFQVLQNEQEFLDDEIPAGFSASLEKKLSTICIDKRKFKGMYGTRTMTVCIVDENNTCTYAEMDRYDYETKEMDRIDRIRIEEFRLTTGKSAL